MKKIVERVRKGGCMRERERRERERGGDDWSAKQGADFSCVFRFLCLPLAFFLFLLCLFISPFFSFFLFFFFSIYFSYVLDKI